MSNINLINLPNEILEKIFDFLRLKDIKRVTRVCKQFSEVVGNSNKLMNKMKLRIVKNKDYTQLAQSSRKYQAIWMYNIFEISEILESFLQKQSNIINMQFSHCSLKVSEFYRIMNCVSQTIDDLNFDNTIIKSDCIIIAMEFPKLESLSLVDHGEGYGFDLLINLFYGAKNVKKFFLRSNGPILNFQELNLIWELIGSMLNIRNLSFCSQLFKSKEFLTTQFKLDNLDIFCARCSSTEIMNNIGKFLDTQRSTLKFFCLRCAIITPQMQQSILSMKKLKKLIWIVFTASVDENEIAYTTNNSIEEIFLCSNGSRENEIMVQNFLIKCIGLKKLCIYRNEISFDLLYTLGHYVENLENLSLNHCTFFPMTMPKIKEMTLIDETGDDDNIIRMIRLNRQLKKLKLSRFLQNNPRCISAIQEINVNVEFS